MDSEKGEGEDCSACGSRRGGGICRKGSGCGDRVMSWVDALIFAINGMIGAFLYIVFWRIREPYEVVRHCIVGAIVGYVFFFVHTEYGVPNLLVTIFLGYSGIDIVEAWFEKIRKLREVGG